MKNTFDVVSNAGSEERAMEFAKWYIVNNAVSSTPEDTVTLYAEILLLSAILLYFSVCVAEEDCTEKNVSRLLQATVRDEAETPGTTDMIFGELESALPSTHAFRMYKAYRAFSAGVQANAVGSLLARTLRDEFCGNTALTDFVKKEIDARPATA